MITFIDNAEDRIVVECDADWYERKFCAKVITHEGEHLGHVPNGTLLVHMGLPSNWEQTKTEYTGDTYIITLERMWTVGVV